MMFGHGDRDNAKECWLRTTARAERPDVIVVSGDVHESVPQLWDTVNPFSGLVRIFGDVTPVVFVLGNHEMFFRTWRETVEYYRAKSRGYDSVRCLDVDGSFCFGGVTFLGNFLGYDGSTGTMPGQVVDDWAGGNWADSNIVGYGGQYQEHTAMLQDSIRSALISAVGTTVLVTHTVPHSSLNGWIEIDRARGGSPYNAYSGLSDFLETIKADYSLSGHTHSRVMGRTINGCRCVNIGNDYDKPWAHHVLEI